MTFVEMVIGICYATVNVRQTLNEQCYWEESRRNCRRLALLPLNSQEEDIWPGD